MNLIVQNQQKKDEIIEAYIKKSVCGSDGADPKVCCPALIFSNTGSASIAPTTAIAQAPQPGPFIFSAVTSQVASTSQPQNTDQPTFSPLTPSSSNRPDPTNPANPPNTIIFGPITNPTIGQIPTTRAPITVTTTPGPYTNRLPTYDVDKCGVSYAVRSRIVG